MEMMEKTAAAVRCSQPEMYLTQLWWGSPCPPVLPPRLPCSVAGAPRPQEIIIIFIAVLYDR